jgi:diguanylate cyclase (GGDEF)-like protein
VTGADGSPLRFLIVVHLVTVALLASYRTGMKVAMWHSLLLLVVYYAADGGALPALHEQGGLVGSPTQNLIAWTAVFWGVTLATASLSAVNERELRRRRYDLEALATLARRLEEEQEPAAIADALVATLVDSFGFERALVLATRGDEPLVELAAHGCGHAGDLGAPHIAATSVVTHAMETRERQLVRGIDPSADAWLAQRLPKTNNVVVVPLSAEGRAIGAVLLEVGNGRTRVERRVVGMVERFTSQGALALRNAFLLEEVRRMASTDGLTGLANRQTFDERLTQELSRAGREQSDVALVMLDVDHFKRLNDTFGHQTGDDVLRRVAKVLRDSARTYDLAARYGGEEFALILPQTTLEDAVLVADRLREAIAATFVEPPVTISAGVATFPFGGSDSSSLIAAADAALYESKSGGRNRVTAALPELQV